MKRILSTLLVAAMLLSLVIVASVNVAAVDGQWTVYAPASQYAEDFEGDPKSVPGYEYTDDGFHMIHGNWSSTSPWGLIQTKDPVDLKDGVFVTFRVDDYSYDASDKWFNVNIWDSQMIEPPVEGFGEGVQTLLRPSADAVFSSVAWYINNFTSSGSANVAEESKGLKTEDGKVLINLTITWDGASYAVDINGAAAPEKVITYMNEKWGTDSEAYIGLCMQNDKKGGTVEATVLKFGTSEADATIPMGDDKLDPVDNTVVYAEIADASTVPAGQPAIFMNGDRTNSHTGGALKAATDCSVSVNDDFSVHVVANAGNCDGGTFRVKSDVSYAIEDFPVVLCLTKNFCTCGSDECYALESVSVYTFNGESIAPAPNNAVREIDMCYDPYYIGEDSYLFFYTDLSDEYSALEASGRINGARFDFTGIDYGTAGANAFDLMFVAYFRNVDEAEAYVENYLTELGWSADAGETDPVETDPVETTPVETTPVEPTPAETDPVDTTPTDKPAETDKEPATTGGCGSVVGFGAIAVVAVAAACGMVAFKKKED